MTIPAKPTVALIAPGGMGAPLGQVLVANGLEVRTSLEGRSAATAERASAAGLTIKEGADLLDVDIILSVVPPSQALLLASSTAQNLRGMSGNLPIYVDCNAVNPKTAQQISDVFEGTGCQFVDGGIIGGPPRTDYVPTLFVSGKTAGDVAVLNNYGFDVSVLDAPIGAASALKMSYAGITKGLIAVASAMILAAERNGAGEALQKELLKSQSQLFTRFSRSIPDMFSKARRWAPEMDQIAGFVAHEGAVGVAEADVYKGIEAFYERMADNGESDGSEIEILRQFFEINE